jgi:hypothetical protein
MRVSGGGSWQVHARTLRYTVGSSQGSSVVSVNETTLTLTPDPVLTAGDQKPVAGIYRRAVFRVPPPN